MKTRILLTIAFLMSGCAHIGHEFHMQPDGSYVIHTYHDDERVLSKETANKLCPKGYLSKSDFSYTDENSYLIIKCRE